MKHIFSKLMLAFLGMAALTICLIWLVQALLLGDSYLKGRIASIDAATERFVLSEETDYAALEESLNISLLSLDPDGSILYQSDGLPMRGQIVRRIPELAAAAGGGVEYLQTETEDARYALLSRAVPGGFLLIVFSLVDVNEASRVLLQQLWILSAVLLLMALLLSVVLSRLFSRPILRVTAAAKRLAAGDYGTFVSVSAKDEIGQLTRALNELGTELGKAESLRRELIANVSHELRVPLTIIQGFAETVRDITWPDEEKRNAQLTMIAEEATRLSGMVNDILDYSKLESGSETISLSSFDGGEVLSEVIGCYEMEAGKKDIAIELQCRAGTITFDRGMLIRVLNNLVANAVQHAYRRTVVTVRCEERGNAARISVENTGAPIPENELESIWDRYHRIPQTGAAGSLGTGLGLAIVKSILVQHGVDYGVKSDPSRTVFWFDTLERI